ncbi:MAG: hypothetical protein WCJ58_03500 [bacterium]
MNAQEYLKTELETAGKYQLNEEDKKYLAKFGIKEFIYKSLTRKKFRRLKVTPETEQRVRTEIDMAVDNTEPLQVVFVMGAYKLWSLTSFPYPDWAEFFAIAHYLKYLAPIAAAYAPGVKPIYYQHTLLMELHDNLTTSEINCYINNFQKLLDKFNRFSQPNLLLQTIKDSDIYPRERYFQSLQKHYADAEKNYKYLSIEKQNRLKEHGRINIKWLGKEDWTELTSGEKEGKLTQGAIYELAAMNYLPLVNKQIKGKGKILVFSKQFPEFLVIGSCVTSITKFWVGKGILEWDMNKKQFYPRILSPNQLHSIDRTRINSEFVNLINLQNFEQIDLYNGRLKFQKYLKV